MHLGYTQLIYLFVLLFLEHLQTIPSRGSFSLKCNIVTLTRVCGHIVPMFPLLVHCHPGLLPLDNQNHVKYHSVVLNLHFPYLKSQVRSNACTIFALFDLFQNTTILTCIMPCITRYTYEVHTRFFAAVLGLRLGTMIF